MARIQVVGVRDLQGIGKDSQRAYKMRIVKVVATDNEGICEVGEITFFERKEQPLPALTVGASYEPIVSFENDKGKIQARITSLKPLVASAKSAA